MSENAIKKMELLDINYKRAAINIGHSIIGKIELADTAEKLFKEIESAYNDYLTLYNNYKKEKEAKK